MRAWIVILGVLATGIGAGCKKGDEVVPPAEAHGCVSVVQGKDFGCAELDAAATPEEHDRFAAACPNEQLKNLRGRLVRHCSSEEVAAECVVSAEKLTIRYYKSEMTPGAQRGAPIGCRGRGGVYSEK